MNKNQYNELEAKIERNVTQKLMDQLLGPINKKLAELEELKILLYGRMSPRPQVQIVLNS